MFEVGTKVVRYFNTDNEKWQGKKPKGDIFEIRALNGASIAFDREEDSPQDYIYWNRSNFRIHVEAPSVLDKPLRVLDNVLKREGTESLEWNRFISEQRKDLLGKTSFIITSISDDGEFVGIEGSETVFLAETFARSERPKKLIDTHYYIGNDVLSVNDLINLKAEIGEMGL